MHYGDTTLTFLSNLQRADDRGQGLSYISAVAVEEKSVWDYNQGNPSGDPTTLGKHAKPQTPLVAIYPKEGTLLSDSPYAVLKAAWVDRAGPQGGRGVPRLRPRRRGAGALRARRPSAGYDGKPGSAITHQPTACCPRSPRPSLSFPAPPVLAQVQALWNEQRKGARVLLIIDTSGSMGESAGNGVEQARARQDRGPEGARPVRPQGRRGALVVLHPAQRQQPALPRAGAVHARSAQAKPLLRREIQQLAGRRRHRALRHRAQGVRRDVGERQP